MRLYNTLTRSEETFMPGPDNTVRMYTYGLTVYARGHIGNFRTFICLDVLRRTLKYLLGYRVRQVMNFTDVDDRTIAGAEKAGLDLRAYTDQYIEQFREDLRALGLEEIEEMPRATDAAAVRTLLGPRRIPDRRRAEDVEVARQHLYDSRRRRSRIPPVVGSLPPPVGALSETVELHVGKSGQRRKSARTAD